ncbi:MAG: hypothetical protein AAF802_28690 [Planctomycetota bacterium]
MPAFDTDSPTSGGDFSPVPADHWSMPIGRVAGVRLYVSYSIFVALAALFGLVTMVQGRPGNGDLPLLTIVAITIWMAGWLVQFLVQFGLHCFTSARREVLIIGLLGVEAGPPLRVRSPWSALANLSSTFCTMTALFLFGACYLVLHMAMQTTDWLSWQAWRDEFQRTGFGFGAIENIALTATWLFWVQACCQIYPLPKHLGRSAAASLVAVFASEADVGLQLRLLKRLLQIVAIATVMAALVTVVIGDDGFSFRWMILIAIAVYLWVSTNYDDLGDWLTAVAVSKSDPASGHFEPMRRSDVQVGWFEDIKMHRKRKRAKVALKREREEAVDLSRLDQVLEQVGRDGIDSISRADRELLQRVSEKLNEDR